MESRAIQIKKWQAWIMAARPKTLTVALIPVLIATALAHAANIEMNWGISVSAFLVALFITIGTNLINDAIDYKKGSDTVTRVGPMRASQTGLIPMQQVYMAGMTSFTLAMLFGAVLIYYGGWPIALLLVISVFCGYIYTGGPVPLSYHGLGEPFVIIFYGFVSVGAVYYLLAANIDIKAILAGFQIGLLATLIISLNNYRDLNEDAKALKKTIAVRFGIHAARLIITAITLLPFALNLSWLFWSYYIAAILPLMTLPLAINIIKSVWSKKPGKECGEIFVNTAKLHLFFGILLTLGLWIS
jgi:1,4-dihydroxy-2-naphthoate octaprenyltransferase